MTRETSQSQRAQQLLDGPVSRETLCLMVAELEARFAAAPLPADPPPTQRMLTVVYGEQGWVVVPNPQAGMPKEPS